MSSEYCKYLECRQLAFRGSSYCRGHMSWKAPFEAGIAAEKALREAERGVQVNLAAGMESRQEVEKAIMGALGWKKISEFLPPRYEVAWLWTPEYAEPTLGGWYSDGNDWWSAGKPHCASYQIKRPTHWIEIDIPSFPTCGEHLFVLVDGERITAKCGLLAGHNSEHNYKEK